MTQPNLIAEARTEEAKERLAYSVRTGDTVQDVALRVVESVLAERDTLTQRNERLAAALEGFDSIVESAIVEKDGPHRVKWNGEWIEGAAADCVYSILRACQKVARTALEGSTP